MPSSRQCFIPPARPTRIALVAFAAAAVLAGATVAEPGADAPPAAPAERAPEPAAKRPDRHPELKRLSRTEEVWIDKAKKQVVVGGRVVLDAGPIEVFACVEKTKEHEAIVDRVAT